MVVKRIGINMIDSLQKDFVFVLHEVNDDGESVLGVYREYADALKDKYNIIRDYFDISEDEVADENLDDEIALNGAYYTILKRQLL
jgi:hypothetical protein